VWLCALGAISKKYRCELQIFLPVKAASYFVACWSQFLFFIVMVANYCLIYLLMRGIDGCLTKRLGETTKVSRNLVVTPVKLMKLTPSVYATIIAIMR
jgi:hypothetical protein